MSGPPSPGPGPHFDEFDVRDVAASLKRQRGFFTNVAAPGNGDTVSLRSIRGSADLDILSCTSDGDSPRERLACM